MNKEELKEMLIVNQDDIYVYFAIIDQLKPKKILDFGMYLKRIGAVCRQVCDCEIPREIRLDALDIWTENFPVYQKVYDNIYDPDSIPNDRYELICALYLPSELHQENIFAYMAEHGDQILIEDCEEARAFFGSRMNVQMITIGNEKQFLLAVHS